MAKFILGSLVIALSLVNARADLVSNLKGKAFDVVFPGDDTYFDASAPHNHRFNFQPAAITYPTTVEQVSYIVNAGYRNEVNVVARSGGYSYIENDLGGKDGALVVDMGNFNKTVLHNDTTATIGPGSRLGDVYNTLHDQGRAIPLASEPSLGMGGFGSYGGFGPTSRMWGLMIDNIISYDVVLANGTVVTASKSHHSNLFWALRGAAPSFGIITSFKVKTYPALSSAIPFHYQKSTGTDFAAQTIIDLQSCAQNAPPELALAISLGTEYGGGISIDISGVWYGNSDDFSDVTSCFTNVYEERLLMHNGTYLSAEKSVAIKAGDLVLEDHAFYARSIMVPQSSPLTLEHMQNILGYFGPAGFDLGFMAFKEMTIELWGGRASVINSVQTDTTAFPHRNKLFNIEISVAAYYSDYLESNYYDLVDNVESILQEAQQGDHPGAYLNYIEDGGRDMRGRYYGAAYNRLSSLKKEYDPTGVFTFPNGVELPSNSSTPIESALELHPNGNLSKCVGVDSGSALVNGTMVKIFDCDLSTGQRWVLERSRTQIRLKGTSYCLDTGSAPKSGNHVKIWTCIDKIPAQSWVYSQDNTIRLFKGDQCLDLTDGTLTDGNHIQTWKCFHGNTNQLWTI